MNRICPKKRSFCGSKLSDRNIDDRERSVCSFHVSCYWVSCYLHFSITFPAPVFRCDMESKQWIVGIRGFIEYHNLFGIINVLFIAILVGVIGLYVIKEKS